MKRSIALLSAVIMAASVSAGTADAQNYSGSQRSEKIKPAWLKKLPAPSNGTFTYVVSQNSAFSIKEAREACLTGLVIDSGFENGMVVVSNINSTLSNSMVWQGDKLESSAEESYSATSTMKGKETPLALKSIAEYWERDRSGEYRLYSLYAKSSLGQQPVFDNVQVTTAYGGRGLWRSAIIPGWGQMYKGSTGKGIAILSGTAVCAGGIVYTEYLRKAYIGKMKNSMHDVQKAQAYQNRAKTFGLYRNVCIGATAALYIYNLIDAAIAPGASRIVPVSYPQGGVGVSYSTNF